MKVCFSLSSLRGVIMIKKKTQLFFSPSNFEEIHSREGPSMVITPSHAKVQHAVVKDGNSHSIQKEKDEERGKKKLKQIVTV